MSASLKSQELESFLDKLLASLFLLLVASEADEHVVLSVSPRSLSSFPHIVYLNTDSLEINSIISSVSARSKGILTFPFFVTLPLVKATLIPSV